MKLFSICSLSLLVLAGTSSKSDSAVPTSFEVEVGIIAGATEIQRFRGDTMTITGLRARAGTLPNNSIVGLTYYPDGADKNFTMFDVLTNGKLTIAAKGYGATENSSLQTLCMAHHAKYHGR